MNCQGRWKSRVVKPTVLGDEANCRAAFAEDEANYINPGYGLSLVDILWNASSYRQPLEQEGIQMT